MKVRCTDMKDGAGRVRGPHPSITVGREYVVIAIECEPRRGSFYRIVENETVDRGDTIVLAGLWPAEMFEVTSTRISPRWTVKAVPTPNGIHLELGPTSWMREGFWDDLLESGPESVKARDDYQQEIIALLTEEHQRRQAPSRAMGRRWLKGNDPLLGLDSFLQLVNGTPPALRVRWAPASFELPNCLGSFFAFARSRCQFSPLAGPRSVAYDKSPANQTIVYSLMINPCKSQRGVADSVSPPELSQFQ